MRRTAEELKKTFVDQQSGVRRQVELEDERQFEVAEKSFRILSCISAKRFNPLPDEPELSEVVTACPKSQLLSLA